MARIENQFKSTDDDSQFANLLVYFLLDEHKKSNLVLKSTNAIAN